jgi:hypothetical protein
VPAIGSCTRLSHIRVHRSSRNPSCRSASVRSIPGMLPRSVCTSSPVSL